MYKYFLIEKDRSAIEKINSILNDFQHYKCNGSTGDNVEAMNTILKESPNLVFFNIDNTVDDPFLFVHELSNFMKKLPTFIAISSFKNKSYQVIKNGFSDILLNPITDLEIRKTILNFQKRFPVVIKKRICLKSYKDFQYLNTDEILFLKADNNATDFYMKDGRVISAFKTLKTFEQLLPKEFLRIHKSYIINKDFVSRIQFGKSTCTIKNNRHDIPFTKTYLDNIELMNNTLSYFSYQTLN
ncbi:MAG: LytTR family transcriptional regulator DNA-binding domain-containing protein [Flavobacteriaceae bacterium]|nr:LytTR family transcriptional regulator DNA-binding domain-containing protein [Flavobacteriaceae bacterium]